MNAPRRTRSLTLPSPARGEGKKECAAGRSADDSPRLSVGGPMAVAEPVAVSDHLRALRLRRVPLAGRGFVAAVRRRPAQLDTVVRIIRHFQTGLAVDDVLERQRPGG